MHRPPIEFRELYIFQMVASTGNMTVAAGRLGMTQAAVSQALKQLEKRLEIQLVQRSQRPLVLTPAGIALQLRSDSILDQIEAIPAALHQAANQRLPEVRVGLMDTFAANAGAAFVKQLMGAAVRVQVESGSAPALNDAFLQIERHLRRLRVNAVRTLEIDSSEALLAMVADGAGWAITTPLCLLQGRT
ncbi:LysR family transcriptional regulator, partial [Bradyrhizobium sp.]|uniref:LysR family transcriptional regulator n=1 Tax=Bradyrhizobium sp. TaxID=376 RepID=UPI001ECEF912